MTAKELAENIGNIDQRLVESAERTPNYGRRKRKSRIRRTLALAAAAVLMTASFAAGAMSGDRGPETIPIPEGTEGIPDGFQLVPVEIGIADSTNTEILWGIDEGTTVFLAGPTDLYADMNAMGMG